MNCNALLSLDLEAIEQKKRQLFYDKLLEFGWEQLENITTTFVKQYSNRPDILLDINSAREMSQISPNNIHYAFLYSPHGDVEIK